VTATTPGRVLRFLVLHPRLVTALDRANGSYAKDCITQLFAVGYLSHRQVEIVLEIDSNRATVEAEAQAFLDAHPGLADALENPHPFTQSCAEYLRERGRLTDPQYQAVMDAGEKWERRRTPKQRLRAHIGKAHPNPPVGLYRMTRAGLEEWHTIEHPDCIVPPTPETGTP
jgi:hypothetical protein